MITSTTITIAPNDRSQPEHNLSVPTGEAAYWALRLRTLCNGQLAYIRFTAEAEGPRYFGQVVVRDELAEEWLRDQHLR